MSPACLPHQPPEVPAAGFLVSRMGQWTGDCAENPPRKLVRLWDPIPRLHTALRSQLRNWEWAHTFAFEAAARAMGCPF